MSISSIVLASSNTSSTLHSILRRPETQQTPRFQNYLDVLLNTAQFYSFMSIIIESGTSTPLIPIGPPKYSTPKPSTPEPLTLYTLYRYLTPKSSYL